MTQSLEDYLEMVSFLCDEAGAGAARVTDIASRLGFSKPSVITAMKTLESQGLLEHERYSTVTLTPRGRVRAAEIRDRHRFLTAFLHEKVGVSRDQAEADACKIEHVISAETLAKLKSFAAKIKADAPKSRRRSGL